MAEMDPFPGCVRVEKNKLLTPVDEIENLLTDLNSISKDKLECPENINFNPDGVEQGMAKLVMTVLELLYQLMERQALKRMEGGSLTDDEIERLGLAFMKMDARIDEIVELFGLEREDLNLDLGPLGALM